MKIHNPRQVDKYVSRSITGLHCPDPLNRFSHTDIVLNKSEKAGRSQSGNRQEQSLGEWRNQFAKYDGTYVIRDHAL